ncbi:MAG: putative sugar O-methyltransferase [Thalassobaculum sp.]
MTDHISNEELLDRYARLCEAADRHDDEGWRSAHEDGIKRSITITPDQLGRFASMAIGGIGFEPGQDYQGFAPVLSGPVQPVPPFSPQQIEVYRSIVERGLANHRKVLESDPTIRPEAWKKAVSVDGVVGGASVSVSLFGEPVRVSAHTLRVAPRAFWMHNMVGHFPRAVLEIGGGHGRFARDLRMLVPGMQVVYCDLTFNLLLTARYLTRVFGSDVHLAWDDDEPIPSDARIVLLPPWRLREIPFQVEVCCNYLSFHHMETRNVRYYSDRLTELDVAAIFHINRLEAAYERETSLGKGSFGPEWVPLTRGRVDTSRIHAPGGVIRKLPVFQELLVRDRHIDRYVDAYRARLAFEKLRREKLADAPDETA